MNYKLHGIMYSGNMVDWWTEDDGKEYEQRVEVMVKQANSYEVHGNSVKGKLTSGENIADLGQLRCKNDENEIDAFY